MNVQEDMVILGQPCAEVTTCVSIHKKTASV